jgi:uncharacterized protein (DUF305 family)
MKNTNIIIIVLLFSLLVNVYQFVANRSEPTSHRMPDGSMMLNNDSSMSMDRMMDDMSASLRGKSGKDLEKTFLQEMIVHHQGAVDMAKELLKGTTNPDLVKFANDIITVQSKEIEMQKQWLKNY